MEKTFSSDLTNKENLTPNFNKDFDNKEKLNPDFSKNSIEQENLTPDFSKNSVDKENISQDDTVETKEIGGGAYKDIPSREGYEKHHMPADSVNKLDFRDGPCISMKAEDHRETASYGNSREAQEYRKLQGEKINQGDFQSAFDMDVKDIRSKFGDKYDGEIQQAQEYINTLKDTERI